MHTYPDFRKQMPKLPDPPISDSVQSISFELSRIQFLRNLAYLEKLRQNIHDPEVKKEITELRNAIVNQLSIEQQANVMNWFMTSLGNTSKEEN